MQSLTGLNLAAFYELLPAFERAAALKLIGENSSFDDQPTVARCPARLCRPTVLLDISHHLATQKQIQISVWQFTKMKEGETQFLGRVIFPQMG